MNYGHGILQPQVKRDANALPVIDTKDVDLENLCPISLIRTHTKSDDVPYVTDEQLVLYRKTAFEAAEKYTGFLFTQQRAVTENVSRKSGRRWRDSYTHRLRYPSADGRVYLYGSRDGIGNRMIDIGAGERNIRIPVQSGAFDLGSCCDPCRSDRDVNYGWKVLYKAGINCKDDVPAGIVMGVLKMVAFLMMNAGDEILTVRNREQAESTGIIGTNNAAWASGAIEQWRIYVDDAI